MAKFDKIAVLNKIGSTGMVPVFYHKDADYQGKSTKVAHNFNLSNCIVAQDM